MGNEFTRAQISKNEGIFYPDFAAKLKRVKRFRVNQKSAAAAVALLVDCNVKLSANQFSQWSSFNQKFDITDLLLTG